LKQPNKFIKQVESYPNLKLFTIILRTFPSRISILLKLSLKNKLKEKDNNILKGLVHFQMKISP